MKTLRIPIILNRPHARFFGVFLLIIFFGIVRWTYDRSLTMDRRGFLQLASLSDRTLRYRRHGCACTRNIPTSSSNDIVLDETSTSFCSQFSTLRGVHQQVIAISMYGPKENSLFVMNVTLHFFRELIAEMSEMYPGWILRVYHDSSITHDIVCSFECQHPHVDFCNASALGNLGNVADFMPPKIWRFLPAGDLTVDVMASRDLDSPLSSRELAAVKEWLASDKAWHTMRDHPYHSIPMLGGMWGFRNALNRTFAAIFLKIILNRTLIARYGGREDQSFLGEYVWPSIQKEVIAHDSHLCQSGFGKGSRPWPTRRPLLNESGCFVGCIRPCCQILRFPFGECPVACRPVNHKDWTMC